MPQRRRTLFCVSGQVIQRLCRMRQSGMADPSVLFMLERPIPGLNHLRAFESEELADIVYSEGDAASAGITPFRDFCVGWGGRRQWASALAGGRHLPLIRVPCGSTLAWAWSSAGERARERLGHAHASVGHGTP
jgi:hypothetical protein